MKTPKQLYVASALLLAIQGCAISPEEDTDLSVSLPPPAAGMRPEAITGKLEVLQIDDFENHKGEIRYYVHDEKKGKRFQLKFKGKPPENLRTGAFVRVRGQFDHGHLNIKTDDPSSIEELATPSSITAPVFGDQKTIVLVTDFIDANVSCTNQQIEEIMFTDPNNQSVNDLYKETSLNNIQFNGTVAGPFTINYSSTDICDAFAFAQAVDEQAQANGIDLSQYLRKVYVLPKQNSCGWLGSGTIGGAPSQTWITQCDISDVYAHELGHNLGMRHAGTPTSAYGDVSDIMGYSAIGLRQLNGPHQEEMGWRESQIVEITADGTYDIAPLESSADVAETTEVFKIRKPDTSEWYYLTYRQPIGFDSSLSPIFLRGVSIHTYSGTGTSDTTRWIKTLTDGETFSDTVNGLTITQVFHDNNVVSVDVNLPLTCVRNPPTVSVTPQSQTGAAGTTFNYGLTLVNNDSAYCPASTWSMTTNIPSTWADGLTVSGVTLSPGESSPVGWQVTSSDAAMDSNYTLNNTLTDSETTTHNQSVTVNYTIQTPGDTQVPTAPTSLTAIAERKSIALNWQASMDNNVVAGYRVFRDGIQVSTTTTTNYSDADVVSGTTYSYYVRAFDPDNNLSDSSNSDSVTYGTVRGAKKR